MISLPHRRIGPRRHRYVDEARASPSDYLRRSLAKLWTKLAEGKELGSNIHRLAPVS